MIINNLSSSTKIQNNIYIQLELKVLKSLCPFSGGLTIKKVEKHSEKTDWELGFPKTADQTHPAQPLDPNPHCFEQNMPL
ncbi:MAG: hypothetical protein NC224_02980 [Bacteroides sp.]|nr:hypothetical protein [Bacteroides sp.]